MSFIFLTIVAALISYFTTPLVIKFAKKHQLIDDPKKRPHPAHTHTKPIPRAGGLALLIGFIIPVLIFLPFSKLIFGLLVASILTVLIGLFDDRKDLSPYLRFVGNFVTAIIVVLSGTGIPFITNPFGGTIDLTAIVITIPFLGQHSILLLADVFAVLWIVWTMNIVGWSAGVDGQMPGFIAITAIVLGILSWRFSAHDLSQQIVASLAFITAGTFIGFIPWNFYPQKIMPGYGGKSLAGLLIATIAILSGGKIGSAFLVLAIPMLDAGFQLFRRIINLKSPFRPDRNHLHHYLLDLGWGRRRIALFYWLVSFILGLVALTISSTQKFYIFLSIAVIIFGLLLWISYVMTNSAYDNEA